MERGEGFVVPDLTDLNAPRKKHYRIPNLTFDEIRIDSKNEYGTTYLMCVPKEMQSDYVEGYSSMKG